MKLLIALPAALMASTALAQMDAVHADVDNYTRASDLMATSLYTTNDFVDTDWELEAEVADIDLAYDRIGEIEDILLDDQGMMAGVIAEVGGFLDMGDKHVMVAMDDLQMITSDGVDYYITRLTEEMLEDRRGVDVSAYVE